MKNYEEKLRKYCEGKLDYANELARETNRQQSFGAMDFAFRAGLIDQGTYGKLIEEYICHK